MLMYNIFHGSRRGPTDPIASAHVYASHNSTCIKCHEQIKCTICHYVGINGIQGRHIMAIAYISIVIGPPLCCKAVIGGRKGGAMGLQPT